MSIQCRIVSVTILDLVNFTYIKRATAAARRPLLRLLLFVLIFTSRTRQRPRSISFGTRPRCRSSFRPRLVAISGKTSSITSSPRPSTGWRSPPFVTTRLWSISGSRSTFMFALWSSSLVRWFRTIWRASPIPIPTSFSRHNRILTLVRSKIRFYLFITTKRK